jgi:hypothetical protein
MAVTRDADGRETITVASARPLPVINALFVVVWFTMMAMFYRRTLTDPRVFIAVEYVVLLLPLAHIAIGIGAARRVIRDVRGRDRITFGDDAMTIEQRGALRTQILRLRYDEVAAACVEPQPITWWTRKFDEPRGKPVGHRVVLSRAGADPVRIADHLGHDAAGASWLAERIERTARAAPRTGLAASSLDPGAATAVEPRW